MARCVSKEYFVKYSMRAGAGAGGFAGLEDLKGVDFELGGQMASLVLSREDGKTPLGADSLELDSGQVGGVPSRQSCRDCVELSTTDFKEGTEFLGMEATVGMAGAVVGGVLWVAVLGLSG